MVRTCDVLVHKDGVWKQHVYAAIMQTPKTFATRFLPREFPRYVQQSLACRVGGGVFDAMMVRWWLTPLQRVANMMCCT